MYSLTPREFSNISKGYFKRVEDDYKRSLLQYRGLRFAITQPYLKDQDIDEAKFMPLYFEKQQSTFIDLDEIKAQVEENKLFWELHDKKAEC